MVIARVIGTIVSTIKHPAFKEGKLQVVQPLHLAGQSPDSSFVALDRAQAGIGDTVLVLREGNAAREITQIKDAPIISVIVGIVDSTEIT
jgi:microcompartment protein CcmK/EutM